MKWALGDTLFRQRKHTSSFADTVLYVITFRGCTNNRWKGDLFTIFIYAWNLICSCLAFVEGNDENARISEGGQRLTKHAKRVSAFLTRLWGQQNRINSAVLLIVLTLIIGHSFCNQWWPLWCMLSSFPQFKLIAHYFPADWPCKASLTAGLQKFLPGWSLRCKTPAALERSQHSMLPWCKSSLMTLKRPNLSVKVSQISPCIVSLPLRTRANSNMLISLSLLLLPLLSPPISSRANSKANLQFSAAEELMSHLGAR